MYRVLPQRWWALVPASFMGAFLGFVISAREDGLRELLEAGDTGIVRAAVMGAVVSALASIVLVLVRLKDDTRYLTLIDQYPNARVVYGWPSFGTAKQLSELGRWRTGSRLTGSTFCVLFDGQGISLYSGARKPAPFAHIPWADVRTLGVGRLQGASRLTTASQMWLLRVVAAREGASSTLEFGVGRMAGVFLFKSPTLDEAELKELIDSVGSYVELRTPALPVAEHGDRALVHRPTAWALGRLLSLPVLSSSTLVVVAPALYCAITATELAPIYVPIAIAFPIAIYVLMYLAHRANKREAAAGYTTLNRVHLSREQRHPRTGRVLRAAGAPPLTKEQFREALALSA